MTTQEAPRTLTAEDLWDSWGYSPTEPQREILNDLHKFQLVAGGWRGGKSQTAAVKAATETIYFIAKYGEEAAGKVAWFVAKSYELTRAEHNYTTALLRNFYGSSVKASSKMELGWIRVPTPGGGTFTIRCKSANDPESLAMEAPVWVIVCEAAQVSIDTYENLRGRTVEARQRYPEFGWLHLEGTFEGSLGWYASLWTKWQSPAMQATLDAKSYSLPTHTNTTLFPGGENDPQFIKLKEDTPDNLFSEKYLGIPVPPSGRVHASFDPAVHVRTVAYDPTLPVYLGIDPGYSGQPSTYAVEAAQLVPIGESGFKQWRIFDEIAMNKFDKPGFSAEDVCFEATQRPWWKNEFKDGVIDVAGLQHNATSPDNNAEIWRKKTGMVLRYQQQHIKNQIDRIDLCLKQDQTSGEPGMLISPTCQLLLSEFGGAPNPHDGQVHVYRWATDREGNVTGRVPRDQYCDGIKAFAYLALDIQGPVFDTRSGANIPVKSRRQRRRNSSRRLRR